MSQVVAPPRHATNRHRGRPDRRLCVGNVWIGARPGRPGVNEADQALKRGLGVFGVDVELVLMAECGLVVVGEEQHVGLDAVSLQSGHKGAGVRPEGITHSLRALCAVKCFDDAVGLLIVYGRPTGG